MQSKDESLPAYYESILSSLGTSEKAAGACALFIDLDDSYYHPQRPEATGRLYDVCVRKGWAVILVTGNAFSGTLPRILSHQIPPPHIVIGSVGTEIWIRQPKKPLEVAYEQDEAFMRFVASKKYNRYDIVRKSTALIEELARAAPAYKLNFQHPERELAFVEQEADSPEPYKVSFYFLADSLDHVKQVGEKFAHYFPRQTILISDHTAYNRQHAGKKTKAFCVDILPIGKAGAVQYLTNLLSVTDGIVAGDSGNDVEMLLSTSPNLISILVAGAKEEALAAFPHNGSVQLGDWRVILLDMPSGRKVCGVDTSQARLGPESVVAALEIFPRLQELKNKDL